MDPPDYDEDLVLQCVLCRGHFIMARGIPFAWCSLLTQPVRPGGPGTPSLGEALDEFSLSSNAITTWDFTHYQSLGRADALAELVAVQAARLRFACTQITDEVIEQERALVRNELRERFGSDGAQVVMKLNRAIYGDKHPYHRMPGGDEESLMRITRADVCDFVIQHYRAENIFLSVQRGVTREQAMAAVERYMSTVEGREAIAPAPEVPPCKYSKDVFKGVRKLLADDLDREERLGALSRAQVIAEAIYGRGHPYAT
ncbi:MAG: insulinase family protein, partial [Myxococcota bacterium]